MLGSAQRRDARLVRWVCQRLHWGKGDDRIAFHWIRPSRDHIGDSERRGLMAGRNEYGDSDRLRGQEAGRVGELGVMDRLRPHYAWPLGMGVLIAALPGMTVALVIAAVAFLGVVAVVLVASRGRGSSDPPLENEVLGDWFEPGTSAGADADAAKAAAS